MKNSVENKCLYCGNTFFASRNDAKRCKECYKKKSWTYERLPHRLEIKKEKYRLLRAAVIHGYGGKCQCCNESIIEFLAIDHVNGGGRQDRKKRGIHQIMKEIVNSDFPDTYRVLCHNCNMAIGFYGKCPHKK